MSDASNLPPGVVRGSATAPLVIPANGVRTLSVIGDKFYIVESDSFDPLFIKTDRTAEESFTVGTGKEFPPERWFKGVEIRNNTAVDITITFFIGFGDYIDKRTTIVGNRLSSIMPVRDAISRTIAGGSTTIGATTTLVLTGLPPSSLYFQRKSLIVSNLDAAITLFIRDSLGNNAVAVFPNNSAILFDSGPLQIRNDAGAPVQFSYCETWYAKP